MGIRGKGRVRKREEWWRGEESGSFRLAAPATLVEDRERAGGEGGRRRRNGTELQHPKHTGVAHHRERNPGPTRRNITLTAHASPAPTATKATQAGLEVSGDSVNLNKRKLPQRQKQDSVNHLLVVCVFTGKQIDLSTLESNLLF